MKPLTIEELKALEVDDWVWIVDLKTGENTGYAQIEDDWVECDWDNYGKTWLAYKNKEQEEAKGEIVELPCILKSNSTYPKNQVVYINEFGSVIVERFSYEQEAERRLAELIGGIMKPQEEINKNDTIRVRPIPGKPTSARGLRYLRKLR